MCEPESAFLDEVTVEADHDLDGGGFVDAVVDGDDGSGDFGDGVGDAVEDGDFHFEGFNVFLGEVFEGDGGDFHDADGHLLEALGEALGHGLEEFAVAGPVVGSGPGGEGVAGEAEDGGDFGEVFVGLYEELMGGVVEGVFFSWGTLRRLTCHRMQSKHRGLRGMKRAMLREAEGWRDRLREGAR